QQTQRITIQRRIAALAVGKHRPSIDCIPGEQDSGFTIEERQSSGRMSGRVEHLDNTAARSISSPPTSGIAQSTPSILAVATSKPSGSGPLRYPGSHHLRSLSFG